MRHYGPLVFVLACFMTAPLARVALADQQPAATATLPPPALQLDAQDTRQQLEQILKQYPPSLPQVLRLDPTLLTSQTYLQPYPSLAAFVTQHPEIGHNPSYFFARYERDSPYEPQTPQDHMAEAWRSAADNFSMVAVVVTIAGGILWLLKMLIDYRRWARLTHIQTEAHTKLFDRFGSNEDLLAYIQTPAGQRFLESTPIAIDSPRALSAPFGRILWSAQVGAVLTVLGLGIAMVARHAIDDVAAPLGAIGALVVALGIGFLVSAVLAYVLSRRFGLVQPVAAPQEPRG
ncbi:MAG TPA: hypothetical protein VFX12_10790 [Vicinamibacterales bacterium]|nr:hypothetical protein [Vicinamibacterales bacterium]